VKDRRRTEGAEAPRRQGATPENTGQYLRKKQRSRQGCIGGRMQPAFSPRAASPRYTRTVGSWWLKSVCVVVVGALAAAPAVGMLCAVQCAVRPVPIAAAESTSPPVHHHDATVAADLAPAAAPGAHHAVEGDEHHASASATVLAPPESHPRLTAWGEQECCTSPGQALRFVVAGRADTSIVFPPQTAGLPDAAVFDASNGVQPAPHHAPPRSRSSPTYRTLVLRI
jgi:hypothetical protein